MIEIQNLVKSFGYRKALAGVDLQVEAGELVWLVGPNGAGKTTLLRILATLSRPTSGKVRVAGFDPTRDGIQIRRQIGFLSHRTLLYDDLTAEQNLDFYARLYEVPNRQKRIAELLRQYNLTIRKDDWVRTFSRGMQQRLAIARALLPKPRLLLLDEPYNGLDPLAADTLDDEIAALIANGCTVLLTTHNLEGRNAMEKRTLILNQGHLIYDNTTTTNSPLAQLYRQVLKKSLTKDTDPL